MSQFKLRKAILSRVIGSNNPKLEKITYPSTETPEIPKRSLTWVKEGTSLIVNIHELHCDTDKDKNKEIMACIKSANRVKEVSTLTNIRSLSLKVYLWNFHSDKRTQFAIQLVKAIISRLEKIETLSLEFRRSESSEEFCEFIESLITPNLRTLRSLTLKLIDCDKSYSNQSFLVKFINNIGLNLPLLEKLHIDDSSGSRGPVDSATIFALTKQLKSNLRYLKHLILDLKRFGNRFEVMGTLVAAIASRWRALETFHLYLPSKNYYDKERDIVTILSEFGPKLAENIKDFCFDFKPFAIITKNNKLISYTFGPPDSYAITNESGTLREIVQKIKMPYFLELLVPMNQEDLQIVSEQFKSSLQSLENFDLGFTGGRAGVGPLDNQLAKFIDQLTLNLHKLKELGIQFTNCKNVTDQTLMALTKQMRRKFDTLDLFQIIFPMPEDHNISYKTIVLLFNELKAKFKSRGHFDLYFRQKIHVSNKPHELIKPFVPPDLSHFHLEFFYSKNTDKLILNFFEQIQPHLSGIQSLHIGFVDYQRLNEETMIKILSQIRENLPSLVFLSLDFSECKKITDKTTKALVSHIKFTALKVLLLNFSNCQEISNDTLFMLAEEIGSKPDPLESLVLNFTNCTKLTDDSVAKLAQCFPPLKTLHLVFDSCNAMTNKSFGIIFANITTTLKTLHLSFTNCQSISDIAMLYICDIPIDTMNTLIRVERLATDCAEAKGAAIKFIDQLNNKIRPGIANLKTDAFDERNRDWVPEEAKGVFDSFEQSLHEILKSTSNIDKYKTQAHAIINSFSTQQSPELAALESIHLDFRGCQKVTDFSLMALSYRINNLKSIKHLSLDFEGCGITQGSYNAVKMVPAETLLTLICWHLNKNIKAFHFNGEERKTILSDSAHVYPEKSKRSFEKRERENKPPKDEELEEFEEAQPGINLDEWELEDSK